MDEKIKINFDYFLDEKNEGLYLSEPIENTVIENNNINIFHSKFIPPVEYFDKAIYKSGEKLVSDIYSPSMIAVSTDSSISYNKNKRSDKVRTVCYGRINYCREIRYISDDSEEYFYHIETIGHDGKLYSFEISYESFNDNLINQLSHKGRLAFLKHRGYTDDDLVRTYIRASAEKSEFVYPYTPLWKNGEYVFATKKHEAKTPFFQNVLSLPDKETTEIRAFQKVLAMLKIFKNKTHRLFFLIMMAYIVLQSLFNEYLKIKEVVSINISKECNGIVYLLLGIFNNCSSSCALSDNQDKIDSYIHNRKGTVAFLENSAIYDNSYYKNKVKNNMTHIFESKINDIVRVIVNNDYDGYVDGAFNITIKDDELDKQVYFKIANDKQMICRYLICFTEWLKKQQYDINVDSNETESVLYTTYTLLSRYNDTISEIILSDKLGFSDNKDIVTAINVICAEKDVDKTGEWVVNRFGEVYRELCGKGLCQKIYLKKNTKFSFDDEIITFIEKDEMICISEKDMKKLINLYIPELTLGKVKVSMSEADALEHDKNNPYLKNIYIPCMKRSVRLIAVKKEKISSVGEINL